MGVVSTISGGAAILSELGIGVGSYILSTGIPSIGLGASMIVVGLTTDPTPEGREKLENMPTSVLNSIGKAEDQVLGNSNHKNERIANFIDATIGLGSLKSPQSILDVALNGISILQFTDAALKLEETVEADTERSVDKLNNLPQKETYDWQEDFNQKLLWNP